MVTLFADFETYWDDLYSLSKLDTIDYVTDARFKTQMLGVALDDGDPVILRPDEIKPWLDALRARETHITLVCQNALFDGLIFTHHYNFVPDFYMDTKAMSKGLWPHESSSLKNVAVRLFPDDETKRKLDGLLPTKGVRDFDQTLFDDTAIYCKRDVTLMRDCLNTMMLVFPSAELDIINQVTRWGVEPKLELDFDLMSRYIPKLDQDRRQIVTNSGLWRFAETYNLDSKSRAQFRREFAAELRKGRVQPDELPYWTSLKVLNSNRAFEAFLLTQGIHVPRKLNPKGEKIPALGQSDPEFIELMKMHPQLQNVWDAREAAKSTMALSRARRFVHVATALGGRMPAPVIYNQAHTGRLGGTDSLNMQNLPRNAKLPHPEGDLRPGALRRALLAPEGYVVHVADLSNIECRMLAYEAGHEVLLDLFRNGGDPYLWQASSIYNQPLTKAANPNERNVGKATVLGCGYGMGAERFMHYLHSGPMGMPPIHFADAVMYGRIIATYRRDNAPIVQLWAWGNQIIELMATLKPGESYVWKMLVIQRNRIILPSGLPMDFPNLRRTDRGWMYDSREDGNETYLYGAKLIENITQALANCVMKEAMRRVDTFLITVLQVHDEIVALGRAETAAEDSQRLLAAMRVVPDWCQGLPIDAEVGYAANYSK